MHQTRCIHCHVVGFVRKERVIAGRSSGIHLHCGHCNYSWSPSHGKGQLTKPTAAGRREERSARS